MLLKNAELAILKRISFFTLPTNADELASKLSHGNTLWPAVLAHSVIFAEALFVLPCPPSAKFGRTTRFWQRPGQPQNCRYTLQLRAPHTIARPCHRVSRAHAWSFMVLIRRHEAARRTHSKHPKAVVLRDWSWHLFLAA